MYYKIAYQIERGIMYYVALLPDGPWSSALAKL